MKTLPLVMLILFLSLIGCSTPPAVSTVTPISTEAPTPTAVPATATPTLVPSLTPTLIPTSTPQTTPTVTPMPTHDLSIPLRVPNEGDNMTSWGWPGSIQIWGNAVQPYDCHNTGVLDYICDPVLDPTGVWKSTTNRIMHEWKSSSPFDFSGYIPLENTPKTFTITFKKPVQNIALTSGPGDRIYIDSIVGITPDGTRIPMGFTLDDIGALVPAPLFFDGYSSGVATYLEAERKLMPPPVCGMVGPQTDENYTELGGFDVATADGNNKNVGSFILFRLPQTPASQLTNNDLWVTRGVNVYEMVAVEITALLNSPPNNICP